MADDYDVIRSQVHIAFTPPEKVFLGRFKGRNGIRGLPSRLGAVEAHMGHYGDLM